LQGPQTIESNQGVLQVFKFSFDWALLLLLAVAAVLLASKTLKVSRSKTNELNAELQGIHSKASPTNIHSKGAGRRLIMKIWLALTFSHEAAADSCTINCQDSITPIPYQIKYQKLLPLPEILNLTEFSESNYDCNTTQHIYMKMADQDWGIKDSDNATSLLTPIYGYSLSEEGNATFPGPTIVASKGCAVHIEFHNNLGIGQHMFDIDRSVHCDAVLDTALCDNHTIHGGTPLPPLPLGVDDEFFCRCASEHGSERRTTVSMNL
jgi:hypothetical protein